MPNESPGSFYDQCVTERGRVWVSGLAGMAVAGVAPQQQSLVRLTAPYAMEFLAFTATKVGGTPVVPSPIPPNPNLVLVYSSQSGLLPLEMSDGSEIYCVTGYYLYLQLNAENPTDTLYLGALPTSLNSPGSQYIPAQNWRQDLVNPQTDARQPNLNLGQVLIP